MKKKTYLLIALSIVSMGMNAQNSEKSSLGNDAPEFVKTMKIGGTIRSKYEYQTEEGEGRFEVRTARINVTGNVTKEVSYKAEIDLCDEGKIKMLDAYTRIKPWKTLQLTIGQERVPFTIDAHRSPHQQYFANRSFIAKQVGNVRDVGAEIGYTWNVGFPIVVNAGIFNGSGLTNQKDYWTKGVNYSAKAQFLFPNVNLVLSTQKIKPSDVTVTMYDGGITFHKGGFIAEAEYLYKHYSKDAFHDVHAFDGFVCYDPLEVFNILICTKVLSIFFPISPPKQSISLTKCPFELPPICGLHGIFATVSKLIENNKVFIPILAAASAASHPACPAPITAISYSPALYFIFYTSSLIHYDILLCFLC